MLDFFNKELYLGDTVAFIDIGYKNSKSFNQGFIKSINKKSVTIECNGKEINRLPKNLIKK